MPGEESSEGHEVLSRRYETVVGSRSVFRSSFYFPESFRTGDTTFSSLSRHVLVSYYRSVFLLVIDQPSHCFAGVGVVEG